MRNKHNIARVGRQIFGDRLYNKIRSKFLLRGMDNIHALYVADKIEPNWNIYLNKKKTGPWSLCGVTSSKEWYQLYKSPVKLASDAEIS